MEETTGRTPKPTELVIFNHAATANDGHKQSPAMIHSTSKDGANMTVFGPNGRRFVTKVKEGDKVGEWQWPDAAEKTAEAEVAKETTAVSEEPEAA